MAKFVSLFNHTGETWQKMQANPGDRPAAIGAVVERLGGMVMDMPRMPELTRAAGSDFSPPGA